MFLAAQNVKKKDVAANVQVAILGKITSASLIPVLPKLW